MLDMPDEASWSLSRPARPISRAYLRTFVIRAHLRAIRSGSPPYKRASAMSRGHRSRSILCDQGNCQRAISCNGNRCFACHSRLRSDGKPLDIACLPKTGDWSHGPGSPGAQCTAFAITGRKSRSGGAMRISGRRALAASVARATAALRHITPTPAEPGASSGKSAYGRS